MPRTTLRSRRAVALCLLALLALAMWGIGFVATDRWRWSQYLWWTPWAGYALVALPGAAVSLVGGSDAPRWLRRAATCAFVVLVAVGLIRDVGRTRGRPANSDLSIIHWNASWPDARDAAEPARRILARAAEVVLISNPYRFFGDGRAEAWREMGYDVVVVGIFAVASRVPVLEAREVDVGIGMAAAVFVLDTRATEGRTITVLALDLPSNPRRGRYGVASDCATRLAQQGAASADIVVGDFNITRGSASLELVAGGSRNAWDEAGVGWGASWPRRFPFLHLDHVLLAPWISATHYEFFDPGAGGHRAQQCHVRRREV